MCWGKTKNLLHCCLSCFQSKYENWSVVCYPFYPFFNWPQNWEPFISFWLSQQQVVISFYSLWLHFEEAINWWCTDSSPPLRRRAGVDTDAVPPAGLVLAGGSAETWIILNGSSRLLLVGEVGRFGTCWKHWRRRLRGPNQRRPDSPHIT